VKGHEGPCESGRRDCTGGRGNSECGILNAKCGTRRGMGKLGGGRGG
jgi:hypothetical protein